MTMPEITGFLIGGALAIAVGVAALYLDRHAAKHANPCHWQAVLMETTDE